MTRLIAAADFDMRDLIANGSLAEFFEFGEVLESTETTFVAGYADEEMSEQLTLTGSFGGFDEQGYPTTGTINSASYMLNGVTIFTVSDISISVEAFTAYVMNDDLDGLFTELFGGHDWITGSDGNDVLLGLSGDDSLSGGLGSDELYGGDGHDFLGESSGYDGPFDDIYDGGAGIDRVTYFTETGPGVTVDLRNTGPQDTGSFGTDTLIGIEHVTSNYGDDTLIGNEEANWFWTFSGLDRLTGNGGDDYFTVGLGTKIIDGGEGSDTVEIIDLAWEPLYTADGISVSLQRQGEGQETGVGNWTLTGIENLVGDYGSDDFWGNGIANYLAGAQGDDRLFGGAGDDTLAGDGSITLDSVDGGSGPIIYVENPDWEGWVGGNDYLDGGAGADRMIGGSGNDIYVVDDYGDAIVEAAGAGIDEVRTDLNYSLSNDVEDLRMLGTADIFGYGNGLANVLIGNAGNNKLLGLEGDDRLTGGEGSDRMIGGIGDDLYFADSYSDRAVESAGQGFDQVVSSASFILGANVENLSLTGTSSIWAKGNDLDNRIAGNSGSNKLYGFDGDDRLVGEEGNDRLEGGAGVDKMYGGTGDDLYAVSDTTDYAYEQEGEGRDTVQSSVTHVLRDNIENLNLTGTGDLKGIGNELGNTIQGNSGANTLRGEAGRDWLYGNAGDDVLEGGADRDVLFGGLGADRFMFREGDTGASNSSADIINDFRSSDGDYIHLGTLDADAGLDGDQDFAFVGTDAFTGTAGELRYEQVDGSTYVQGDTNGDGVADFMIRIDGLHALESGDFIL